MASHTATEMVHRIELPQTSPTSQEITVNIVLTVKLDDSSRLSLSVPTTSPSVKEDDEVHVEKIIPKFESNPIFNFGKKV